MLQVLGKLGCVTLRNTGCVSQVLTLYKQHTVSREADYVGAKCHQETAEYCNMRSTECHNSLLASLVHSHAEMTFHIAAKSQKVACSRWCCQETVYGVLANTHTYVRMCVCMYTRDRSLCTN